MLHMNVIKKFKTSYQIKFSNDYRFLCHTTGSKTIIYDTSSWEKIMELSKPNNPGYIHFSENDDYLYIKNTIGTVCVYETVGFQLIKTIKSNKKYQLVEADFALTNTSFIILDTLKTKDGHQLALINIEEGEYRVLTQFKDSITLIYFNQFVQAESAYLFTLSYVNNADYKVHKIVKMKEPIKSESAEVMENSKIWYWDAIIFNSIHNVYIVVQSYDIVILDGQFKEILKKVNLSDKDYPNFGYFQHIHLSNNGDCIIITYSETVLILRYSDLQTILVEKIQYACFAEFSTDNRFILIGTWENGYILENTLR
ncbi:hypothetical protein RRU94_16060 [Domibacillus sp. DTU_2020_1001157_1_SI_ALB_TIR_016]|uniref:hypothetical protein n=1 Tax=Domibacillus sp. DTU_2020_1001157_1_SI_ALB_TIR_016 TaxID=3077789 RepID=UPI0028E84E6C|nr:hypothetical protein [Domibacillus sp. DTU_2020_1001157_1_SI_ALB_TIR_016]WNS82251.1 hypothetical protein RRU94_16060 [Domibacillus sp. DTU_2020_1001157_1_SI_ALB_TIR_016]